MSNNILSAIYRTYCNIAQDCVILDISQKKTPAVVCCVTLTILIPSGKKENPLNHFSPFILNKFLFIENYVKTTNNMEGSFIKFNIPSKQ